MYDLTDDTIVAISSPPGRAMRGIVRCGGPGSIEIAATIFAPKVTVDLLTSPGFRRYDGSITLENDCVILGEIYLFRSPRSYTRQDLVEYHVAGAAPVLAMLSEHLLALGSRQAEPGEFTARAFLNGAIDLTRAEAVAGMIRARSDAQLHAANGLMQGRLNAKTTAILDNLAGLAALVEADIDFAEEPIDFISPVELREKLEGLRLQLHELATSATSAEQFDVLPRVVLIGPSNAGKSTLMNRLTGLDRAICSPVAGTTRDMLSAPMRVGHGEALLIDSAGVDADSAGLMRTAADRSTRAADTAAVRLFVHDVTCPDDAVEEMIDRLGPHVVVGNKIDLVRDDKSAANPTLRKNVAYCRVSAKTGVGIEELLAVIDRHLDMPNACPADHTVLLTARHRLAIRETIASIERAQSLTRDVSHVSETADLIAFEIREALDSLGTIAGSVTTEDLLGRIFGSFCIGK